MWSNCCTERERSSLGSHAGWLALGATVLLLTGCTSAPRAPEPGADPRFGQATVALESGVEPKALALLTELTTDYPTLAGPLVNLGILHATAGRDEEAETAFRQAIDVVPGHAVAWAELGIVLRRQGRFEAADEAYRQALVLQPEYALAWRNRGVLLDIYLGRPDEALACYQRYLELLGEPQADEQVARWVAELQLRNTSRVATR